MIVCGDACEVMGGMSAGSAQLVFTSPPYGIGKAYERRAAPGDYIETMRPAVEQCARIVAPLGFIGWQVGYHITETARKPRRVEVAPLDALYWPLFEACGLRLVRRIVWTFGHGLHSTYRFSGRHEMLLVFARDVMAFDVRSRLEALDEHGEVWSVTNVKANHPERIGGHPCQFPSELPRRLIAALTAPGDVVVDPFAGTGTTCAVAAQLGRQSIGIELNSEYAAMAEARLARS